MAKEKKKRKKDINLSKTYQINGQLTQALLPIRRGVTGWMITVVSSCQVDYFLSNAIPHEAV